MAKDFFGYKPTAPAGDGLPDRIQATMAHIPKGLNSQKAQWFFDAASIVSSAVGIYKTGKEVQSWFKAKMDKSQTITIKFKEGSPEHKWLLIWLAKQPNSGEANEYRVKFIGNNTIQAQGDNFYQSAEDPAKDENVSVLDGEWAMLPLQTQTFWFDDMLVKLGTNKDDTSSKKVSDEDMMVRMRDPDIVVICITKDRSKVLKLLVAIAEAGAEPPKQPRIPGVFVNQRYYGWSRVRNVPVHRSPVLPEGVMEGLIKDLLWFAQAEEWYLSVGVPHRRGYLFHGPPGSGKTTLAIALAGITLMDIYLLTLTPTMTDQEFQEAVQRVPQDGILLLEDIDCVSAATSREMTKEEAGIKNDTPSQVSLQGLLNIIDGVATPDGRLIIATTNYPERIDKALMRPGRVDLQVQFHNATRHQILQLCTRFGMKPLEAYESAKDWALEDISMAQVQERLIERIGLNQGAQASSGVTLTQYTAPSPDPSLGGMPVSTGKSDYFGYNRAVGVSNTKGAAQGFSAR